MSRTTSLQEMTRWPTMLAPLWIGLGTPTKAAAVPQPTL